LGQGLVPVSHLRTGVIVAVIQLFGVMNNEVYDGVVPEFELG
jgi:hypothetical protein